MDDDNVVRYAWAVRYAFSSRAYLSSVCALLFASVCLSVPVDHGLEAQVNWAASRYSLDPKLILAVIEVESGGKHERVSKRGASGLMQVMPNTARELEIPNNGHVPSHLMGACEYLRRLLNRYRGDLALALAAYNAGPSRVDRGLKVPDISETREYVRKVLGAYARLRKTRP